MQPRNGTGLDHASRGRMRLRAALPLAAGIILLGLFTYLLIGLMGDGEKETASVPSDPKIVLPPRPIIPPAVDPQPKGPPPEKGLRRWHFDRPIEGWDPELASKIAEFFEAMEITYGPDGPDHAKLATLEEKRDELQKFLASLGPEAIPTLAAILGEEQDFVDRRFLLYALGDLGPKSELATEALDIFYQKSREDPKAAGEIGHVIQAMGRLKNEMSFQLMNREIDDPSTPVEYRDKFILALGDHPDREKAIPRIVRVLHEDGSVNCRNRAAQFLGKTRKPDTLDQLIAAFSRQDEQVFVKQTILGSIGKLGDERALPFLMEVALRGDPDDVRLSAANAIHRIGTPKAIGNLRELLQVERNDGIRKRIEGWIEALMTKAK
jgi:hypothetical protein